MKGFGVEPKVGVLGALGAGLLAKRLIHLGTQSADVALLGWRVRLRTRRVCMCACTSACTCACTCMRARVLARVRECARTRVCVCARTHGRRRGRGRACVGVCVHTCSRRFLFKKSKAGGHGPRSQTMSNKAKRVRGKSIGMPMDVPAKSAPGCLKTQLVTPVRSSE